MKQKLTKKKKNELKVARKKMPIKVVFYSDFFHIDSKLV